MKKIFRLLNKNAKKAIGFLVRVFLGLAYLVLMLPFALVIRLRTDYLGIKAKEPAWAPLPGVTDPKQMLADQ